MMENIKLEIFLILRLSNSSSSLPSDEASVLQCLEMFLVFTVVSMRLASSEERPGTLLSSLQCTGQPITAKNYLASNVDIAKVEKHVQ
jgi:hypothetical protein